MPKLMLEIAGRAYEIGCREGEEAHFLGLASIVDARVGDAAQALGGLTETRGLLFAALLLADELRVKEEAPAPPPPPTPAEPGEAAATAAIEHLAERLEALAAVLEGKADNPPRD